MKGSLRIIFAILSKTNVTKKSVLKHLWLTWLSGHYEQKYGLHTAKKSFNCYHLAVWNTHTIYVQKIFEVSTGRSAQFDRPLSASGKFPSSAILSALEQSAVSTNVQDKSHLGVEGIALFTFHVMDKSVNIPPPPPPFSVTFHPHVNQ